jgi:hypothetical protein
VQGRYIYILYNKMQDNIENRMLLKTFHQIKLYSRFYKCSNIYLAGRNEYTAWKKRRIFKKVCIAALGFKCDIQINMWKSSKG